jgi:ribosome biogenesis GTPase / thiamine phosphate phosphatase
MRKSSQPQNPKQQYVYMMDILEGLVIIVQSGFFTVDTGQETFVCRLRGRLKRGPRTGDIVAVGDRVKISPLEKGRGMIEEIEPRQRMITRMAPTPRGEYQQIIIANPDQAIFVYAIANPEPRLGMLDRFLITAEKEGLPATIVANKIDLMDIQEAQQIFGHYEPLGYPVIYTSVKQSIGLDKLKDKMRGKISLLAGPSGVGKSSLLNAIQPGLGLAVREVSQATRKGRHTTVVRQLFRLEYGGYVADTPGLKALALWDIEPEELDGYFPELRELVSECQFNDCTHLHEPGCAVKEALEDGRIHPERYRSYQRIRLGEAEAP